MQKWEKCLATILKRLAIEQDEIDNTINNGIKSLIHHTEIYELYDPTVSTYILLPSFSSVYGVAFLLILPEVGLLYDCAEDEKTGYGDRFQKYQLNKEEVEMIKSIKWPTLFKAGSSNARRSRPFQHIFND